MIGVERSTGLPYVPRCFTASSVLPDLIREARTRAAIRKRDRLAAPFVGRLERRTAEFFREQARRIVPLLPPLERQYPVFEAASEPPVPITDVMDVVDGETVAEWQASSRLILDAALARAGRNSFVELGVEIGFERSNARVIRFLDERAAALVTSVSDETRRALRQVIADGIRNRKSWQAVAIDIRRVFDRFARGEPVKGIQSRARMIARTEIAFAMSEGTLEAARQLEAAGLPMEKRWLTAPANEEDPCTANERQDWIPISDSFQSGHMNPPEHPNCLCVLQTRMIRSDRS